MSGLLPIVVTAAGAQPRLPTDLRTQLITLVAADQPGYTASLPGSLIADISGTDVGALTICDSARVEAVNSLTPLGSNAFLLNQLGQIYGIPLGAATNTSVFEVFTGPPGFVIAKGFTVSDGTYQYVIQDGGIIGSAGVSLSLFALATLSGSWDIPSGAVTQLVTSVPSSVSLSVTNPLQGTPGAGAQTEESYRTQVLQAGLASAQGMGRFLKTLLQAIPGVQARLVSVVQIEGGGWEILCGGGDPYFVAYAIWRALFDVSTLVGSTILASGVTQANPGVVTTDLNHGFATGQVINIAGALGMTAINNVPLTIAVLTETTFSIGIDTSGYPAYTGGGVVTPNFRNIVTNINDFPDTYTVPFVNPPAQNVAITLTWNTNSPNFVSSAAIAQLGNPALVNYVNGLVVGNPMNLFELQAVFQNAVSSVLTPQLLTRMVFSVSINGIGAAPAAGTGIIAGDPESYMLTNSTAVIINQG
jgi:hypothetical protein